MSIHFQINIGGDTTDEAIAEFRKVFGGLLGAEPAGAGAPVGGHEQMLDIDTELKDVEVIPPAPKTRKPRGASAKDAAAAKVVENGEVTKDRGAPLPDASSAGKTESASTSSTTETSSTSASDVSSVSIDDLRAKLMSLSKTDGGHDKVFTILGKVGAKNASTVPEDKRGEVVDLVDDALLAAEAMAKVKGAK